MIALSLLTFLGLAQAETIDFYVAPIKIVDQTQHQDIEQEVDSQIAFAISSMYKNSIEVYNEKGIRIPTKSVYDEIRVFNNETIKYYSDCDYSKDPMKCSFGKNYYVETVVTVDDNELNVRMTIYAPDLQIISNGYSDQQMDVHWIRQQEITNIKQTGRDGSVTDLTHYGLEKLPLKWEIPHHLLQEHVRDATVGCWYSAQIHLK